MRTYGVHVLFVHIAFQEDDIVNDILAVADFPTTPFVTVLGKLYGWPKKRH